MSDKCLSVLTVPKLCQKELPFSHSFVSLSSPLPSFYTQQSQSNLALFLHVILTSRNAQSLGSSSHNTIVPFLESLTLNGKTSPGCLFKYLNHQLFIFPINRAKNQQELTDLGDILKREIQYVRHLHVMGKTNKENPKQQQRKPSVQKVHDFQGQSPAVPSKSEYKYSNSELLIKSKHNPGNKIYPTKKQDKQLLLHLTTAIKGVSNILNICLSYPLGKTCNQRVEIKIQ